MGVGQSRELLGKVSDDHVFVCTNKEELLELLARMQSSLQSHAEENSPTGSHHNENGNNNNSNSNENNNSNNRNKNDNNNNNEDDDVCVPVKEIHVPNHYLGDDGLLEYPDVLRVLSASTALHTLDVGYNALTARSVDALAGGSGTPPNLLALNLAGNHIGATGCTQIAEFLATNPPLRELSLFHNGLYDSDVEPILQALLKNTHLRFLNLDFNFLTGKFLRMLIDVLQTNTTLAVVTFDGPYDPKTFESMRPAAEAEMTPSKDDVAAHARVVLRNKLLRADLAGRPPFPRDLVRELESILAPRREKYVMELHAEREDAERRIKLANEEAEREAAQSLCKDAACSVLDGGEEEGEGVVDGEQQAQDNEGNTENDDNYNYKEGGRKPQHDGEDEKKGNRTLGRSAASLASNANSPKQHSRKVRFASSKRGSTNSNNKQTTLPSLPRGARTASTANQRAQSWASKHSLAAGRELSNGFDRLVLAPLSTIPGARTAWYKITGPPCRLRACWCDPRDVAVPYGNILHYHCKHEPTGGDLGDMGIDGKPLEKSKKRPQRKQHEVMQRVIHTGLLDGRNEKEAHYDGCKATSHRCESLGFYGNPKADRSSVFFFASAHPMHANIVE